MWHRFGTDDKFFRILDEEDARVSAVVKAGGCRRCGGRLDRADYPRKPRGGERAVAGEGLTRRRSLCCGRDGCRRRATPPSVVFLGRRVYLAIVVLLESIGEARSAPPPVSPPRRTVRRWLDWFRSELPRTAFFTVARSRLWPPVATRDLPVGIVERFAPRGMSIAETLIAALRFLAPVAKTSFSEQVL